MTEPDVDKLFAGSIPKLYETHLVPLIFQPYADDLARRLAARSPTRVLEIAAGTGVVNRGLVSSLPESAAIAYCQGTPLRNEIEARDRSKLAEATNIAAAAIARRFGPGSVDSKIQAHVVAVKRQ